MWQHIDAFLESRAQRVSDATLRAYRSHLNMLRERDWRTYQNSHTRATLARVARIYVRWCIAHGLLPPDTAVPAVPRAMSSTPRAISEHDFRKLLAAARTLREQALLLLLRDTGARLGAICRLRWSDLDLSRKRALTVEKGGRIHTLRLTTRAVNAIMQLPRDTDTVLGLTVWGAQSMLRRLRQRAGVNGRCNAHSFRHAFARDLLRAGLDLSQVSALLGHADVSTTARYYALWASDELDLTYRTYWEMRYAMPPENVVARTELEFPHNSNHAGDVVIRDEPDSIIQTRAHHATPCPPGHSRGSDPVTPCSLVDA